MLNWIGQKNTMRAKSITKTYRNITVLMWVPFFDTNFGQEVFSTCPELNCHITHNRDAFNHSSAVVFHHINVRASDVPKERLPGQHFVFFLLESPYYASSSLFQQLGINFYTLTMNYRRDSDVHIPYGYFKPRNKPLPSSTWGNIRKEVASKRKLIVWFVSHCVTPSARESYVRQLQQHIAVDVYGSCGPSKCPRSDYKCFERVVKKNYKFYIAFENNVCTDYITEKYFERLNDLVVPIVFGRKIYEAVVPNNSFIAVDDFDNPEKLADYLKRLNEDDDQYFKYFEWRNHVDLFGVEHRLTNGFCNLCRKLQNQKEGWTVTPSKSAKDTMSWYMQKGICHDKYEATVCMVAFKQLARVAKLNSTGQKNNIRAKSIAKMYRNITILMWFSFFGTTLGQEVFSACPELNCHITHNRAAFNQSSAVVFHHRNVKASDVPKKRLPGQHFVLFLLHSPYYTSSELFQQLGTNFYTLTMNYRRDSDVHIPYGYFKQRNKPLASSTWENIRKEVASKRKPIVWFVSKCVTPSAREFYVRQLRKYIAVDVYGKCGLSKCPRSDRKCLEEVVKKNYKFYIAFENSVCTDYVTEKYFDRLNDLVVPIVFRRKIYEAVGPNNSFIAVDDFDNPEKLADYLKRLHQDDDEYLKYFEWRNHVDSFGVEHCLANGFCNLCRKLQDQKEASTVTPSKSAIDTVRWYMQEGTCQDKY
ncbi:hypothetical protein M514_01618, partial [Trichuris suis]